MIVKYVQVPQLEDLQHGDDVVQPVKIEVSFELNKATLIDSDLD